MVISCYISSTKSVYGRHFHDLDKIKPDFINIFSIDINSRCHWGTVYQVLENFKLPIFHLLKPRVPFLIGIFMTVEKIKPDLIKI